MTVALRVAAPADAERCGEICYEAFAAIARAHGFPPDFPSPAAAAELFAAHLTHPGFHVLVAERDGRVVASNMLDERGAIAGIGPITVDPAVQDGRIGRRLMEAALRRVQEQGRPGVRLVQSAYHTRSLALYTKLGFEIREPLVNMQGAPLGLSVPGHAVRRATPGDHESANALCRRVHGHDRGGELRDAILAGTAAIVERGDRVTGYATMVGFPGHAVGEESADIQALIGAAPAFFGPGFLVPARNGELFRWCLAHGLRVVQTMTLMSVGLYNEPRGAYLPSILY